MKTYLAFLLTTSLFALPSLAQTNPDPALLADILKPWTKLLSCDGQGPQLRRVCDRLTDHVRQAILASPDFTITQGSLLWNFHDPAHMKLETGHSCTVTAQVMGVQAWVTLDTATPLNLSSLTLSNPIILAFDIPATFSARIHCKQEFGTRIIDCIRAGSDSFTVLGDEPTSARVVIFISLAPALVDASNGAYTIQIKPIVHVLAEIRDKTLRNPRIEGKSSFADAMARVLSAVSSGIKFVVAWLEKDLLDMWKYMREVVKNDPALRLLVPIKMDFAREGMWKDVARKAVDEKLKGVDGRFTDTLQQRLERAIARALQLDANGAKNYTVLP